MSLQEYAEYRVEARWRKPDGRWGAWGGTSRGQYSTRGLDHLQQYIDRMNAAREGEGEFRIARRWVEERTTDWEVMI